MNAATPDRVPPGGSVTNALRSAVPLRGAEAGDPRSAQDSIFMLIFHEKLTNFHHICLSFKILRFPKEPRKVKIKVRPGELTGISLVRKTQAFY